MRWSTGILGYLLYVVDAVSQVLMMVQVTYMNVLENKMYCIFTFFRGDM